MKTATPDQPLLSQIAARRPPEAQRTMKRVLWSERLTSLWAPLLTLALAFAPYVALVEFHYPSHVWAQPALKAFALLMVGWFVALLVHRLVLPRARRLRRLRVEAHELLSQLDRELRRTEVAAPQRERLVEEAQALDQARLSAEVAPLEAQLGKLSGMADKSLPGWRKRSTVDGVKGLFWTLLAVLALRTLFVEPYQIPTGSMLPTLNLGDHVVVNRFIYGVRIPYANIVPFPIVRRPERGDVIVFNNPLNTRDDFIKRVVGIPGDRVELIDEIVHLNGVPQPRLVVDPAFVVFNRDENGEWYREWKELLEERLDGEPHWVLRNADEPHPHRQGPYVVPEGHVFVLGDNRDSSADSREGFGVRRDQAAFVPYGNIKGKAMVIWLSLSYGGLGSSLFGGTGLRVDRLFTPVR